MLINLLPKPNEIIEESIMFNESLRAFGFKCKVMIPESIELPEIGFQQDVGYNEDDAFYAYISIDSHPKPKLLQSLGWIIEDSEIEPMIFYISRYIQPIDDWRKVNGQSIEILPTKYTRLVLDYDYQDQGKEFIVTKVSSNSFNPVYYIMMVVPYRPRVPKNNVDPLIEDNTEYLNVQEEDQSFRFLNPNTRGKDVNIKY